MTKGTQSHILLLVSAVIFGINYWVSKWLTDSIPVEAIVMLRVIGAGLLFWLLSLFRTKENIPKRDLILLAGAGFLGIAVNQIFFFSGIKLSNPVDVSIIHVTNPFFVLVFSLLFLKARLKKNQIIGLILGATGAIILILRSGQLDFTRATLTGNLLIIVNTISYAGYLVMSKPLLNKYSSVTVMKWISLWGAIFVLPYGANEMLTLNYSNISINTWYSLFYLIVLVTFFAYLFSAYALKNLSTTVVSFYIYLQPMIVAFIALAIGQAKPSLYHLAASIFIFSGVLFVSMDKMKQGKTAIQGKFRKKEAPIN